MTRISALTWTRVLLILAGALVFGYGVRVDDPFVRWIGIGLLALSLIARWWPGGRRRDRSDGAA